MWVICGHDNKVLQHSQLIKDTLSIKDTHLLSDTVLDPKCLISDIIIGAVPLYKWLVPKCPL